MHDSGVRSYKCKSIKLSTAPHIKCRGCQTSYLSMLLTDGRVTLGLGCKRLSSATELSLSQRGDAMRIVGPTLPAAQSATRLAHVARVKIGHHLTSDERRRTTTAKVLIYASTPTEHLMLHNNKHTKQPSHRKHLLFRHQAPPISFAKGAQNLSPAHRSSRRP